MKDKIKVYFENQKLYINPNLDLKEFIAPIIGSAIILALILFIKNIIIDSATISSDWSKNK